ncbi:hypothetical protein J437_LFUL008604 [Ladona fulva]|uniref:Uncharacterized protein n=1 Tax=Ladona fulva TaxID=123851 RepID=A0A8K0KCH2_LADFU|nr:hypothetical protein J437_LFUL008604 [Ladona fulva]
MAPIKLHSLYNLCLREIVNNAELWLQYPYPYDDCSQRPSPFDSLPTGLAQDLLESYERVHGLPSLSKYWQEQARWRLFITSKIKKIIITEFMDKKTLLHVANCCHNLKHLEIRNVEETLQYLKIITPCLPTLILLDLHMSTVSNSALKFIRDHCTTLKILRLKSCYVTDKAIKSLKRVSSLLEVDLSETEVTHSGLAQVLKHNPQIQVLHHLDVVKALNKMHDKQWRKYRLIKNITLPRYQLRELGFNCNEETQATLPVTVATCPFLERVSVEFDIRTATPSALAPLSTLNHLTELHVLCVSSFIGPAANEAHGSGANNEASAMASRRLPPRATIFAGSIYPTIRVHGKHITALTLEGVSGVDLPLLEKACVSLLSLGLYYNTYTKISEDYSLTFPQLRRLAFGSGGGSGIDLNCEDFTAAGLEKLLSSVKSLEELSLSGSPLYSDALFLRVFAANSFPNLRRLELEHCNVSQQVVEWFLGGNRNNNSSGGGNGHNQCRSLSEVSVCGHWVHEQAGAALSFILREKLDVRLEAYVYSFAKVKKRTVRFKQYVNFIG